MTARNSANLTNTQNFNVVVTNTPPTVNSAIGSVTKYDNETFTYTKDLSTVFKETDPNQILTYTVSTVPSFLTASITGSTLTVSGIAQFSNIGNYTIKLDASDSFATVTDNLTVKIIENKPPAKSATFTSNIYAKEGVADSHTIEAFVDTEGDTINYSLLFANGSNVNTSGWMTFDATTRKINYTSPSNVTNPLTLSIVTWDALNAATNTSLTYNTNFKPRDNATVVMRTGEFVCLSHSTIYIDKRIIYDDDNIVSYVLKYANGSAAPSWVQMRTPNTTSSGNFEFNGTYPIFEDRLIEFMIQATDSKGLVGSANFFIQAKCKSYLSTYSVLSCIMRLVIRASH